MTVLDKFLDLVNRSVIVQALLTLILGCAVVYLYVTKGEVPQELLAIFSVVLGYYFRHKNKVEEEHARTDSNR